MSQAVVIENILWSGTSGGAIFNGTSADGARFRFVATSAVMPRPPLQGEVWSISGVRRKHPEHGEQVEVSHCVLQRPSGRLITKVLAGSRSFPGIGAVTARKLWDEFGETLYTLLDRGAPSAFAGLIGEELATVLISGWQELSVEADVYRWLDVHGVPLWIAKKLIAIYGSEVVEKLEENPFRLLAFTNWTQADRMGRVIGIPQDDERRLVAAADAAIYERIGSHHTWTRRDAFCQLIAGLIGNRDDLAEEALRVAFRDGAVVQLESGIQGLGPHSMEVFIATRIAEMAGGSYQSPQMTIRQTPAEDTTLRLIAGVEAHKGIVLNERQKTAVHLSLTAPVAIISGGAGVGKTTVLSAICALSETLGAQVIQLALSGRAARRMEEATGRQAQTIASFINAVDDERLLLDGEPTIAIDESSMLDLPTAYRILRRLEPGCRLILLGDPGQLPPIGFGLVFHAMVQEHSIPQVEMTEIMRQAASTGIPQISRDIRGGRVPLLPDYNGLGLGVSFVDCPQDEISDRILDVVNDLGGVDKCKVVGATKNGPAGTKTINHVFHQLLTPGKPELHGFAIGEPVIWLRNDYDLNLLNGSLGTIASADGELLVAWDGEGEKGIDESLLCDLDLAYAITVHKAQGSQFPRVVVPVFKSRILDRTLLYTAVTRAQFQVVMIGDREAFEHAVVNPPSPSRRETAMATHLAVACKTCEKPK